MAEPPAVKLTEVGFKTAAGPLLIVGETVAPRTALPVKPFTLLSVMLNFPEEPGEKTWSCGLAEIVKSADKTRMLAMKVDQTPPAVETYSPATHTWLESDGSTPAPK